MSLGAVLLGLAVIAKELLLRVWNFKAAVECSLHGSKELGAESGALEPNIEQGMECRGAFLAILLVVHVA